jgi:hypothetical protein
MTRALTFAWTDWICAWLSSCFAVASAAKDALRGLSVQSSMLKEFPLAGSLKGSWVAAPSASQSPSPSTCSSKTVQAAGVDSHAGSEEALLLLLSPNKASSRRRASPFARSATSDFGRFATEVRRRVAPSCVAANLTLPACSRSWLSDQSSPGRCSSERRGTWIKFPKVIPSPVMFLCPPTSTESFRRASFKLV